MNIVILGELPPYNKGGVGTYVRYISKYISKYVNVITVSEGNTNKMIYKNSLIDYYVKIPIQIKNNLHLNAKFRAFQLELLKSLIVRKIRNIDIIHANSIFLPFHRIFPSDAKLVITVHGDLLYEATYERGHLKKNSFQYKITYSIIKESINRADALIAVSNYLKKILIQKYQANPSKIYVIPNGYDPTLFKPLNKMDIRKSIMLPTNKKIILTIGNLIKVKGHVYLIKALRYIIKQQKDILCLIIGDGILRNELQKEIDKYNLKKYIKLVGRIPHKEIPLWINAADVFVLPSLREGNPIVMFEALGCGVPFVGTIVGGVPEIITSEDYGLLCPPKDPKCLAEKILIALEKDWDREKIRKYAQQFTWENIAKQIIKIYRDICY